MINKFRRSLQTRAVRRASSVEHNVMQELNSIRNIEWSVEHKNGKISLQSFSAAIVYADAVARQFKHVKIIEPEKRQISLVPLSHPAARTVRSSH